MTIRQQWGVFGRNPTFSTVDVDGEVKAGSLDVTGSGAVVGARNWSGTKRNHWVQHNRFR